MDNNFSQKEFYKVVNKRGLNSLYSVLSPPDCLRTHVIKQRTYPIPGTGLLI